MNNSEKIAIANLALSEREYKILDSAEVQKITEKALQAGAFVTGCDSLMTLTDEWEQIEEGILERQFYHFDANTSEWQYAKAVALFNDESMYDFYVTDYCGDEI